MKYEVWSVRCIMWRSRRSRRSRRSTRAVARVDGREVGRRSGRPVELASDGKRCCERSDLQSDRPVRPLCDRASHRAGQTVLRRESLQWRPAKRCRPAGSHYRADLPPEQMHSKHHVPSKLLLFSSRFLALTWKSLFVIPNLRSYCGGPVWGTSTWPLDLFIFWRMKCNVIFWRNIPTKTSLHYEMEGVCN